MVLTESGERIRSRVSEALSDKLYVSPALDTASWCNETGYTSYLYIHKVLDSETEPSGGILPLVFGLPFAPEISSFDFKSSPAKALVSQSVVTYWSNFAHSGYPNSPRSIEDLFIGPGSNKEGDATAHSTSEVWKPYFKSSANYFQIDLNPGNKVRYRQHAMSIWLRLVPKLHLSGAEHTFPGHNIFHENPGPGESWDQDSILQLQRVQLNRAFESQQLTTGSPTPCDKDKGSLYSGMMHNATLIKIEEASTAAYNKAILLILLIGFIMLLGNIWFWLCFVIRRKSHSCCVSSHSVGKDISCETELVGSSANTSLQNIPNYSFYQNEYSSDKVSCKSSEGLPRERSIVKDPGYPEPGLGSTQGSISFISQGGSGARAGANVELVPCLKNSKSRISTVQSIATLPRNTNRDNSAVRDRGVSHHGGSQGSCDITSMGEYTVTEMGLQSHRRLGSSRSMERQASDLLVNLSRSSSQGSQGGSCKVMQGGLCQPGPGHTGVSSNLNRPRMSTFCHMMPTPHSLPHPEAESGANQTIQTAASVSQVTSSKYKQPELV